MRCFEHGMNSRVPHKAGIFLPAELSVCLLVRDSAPSKKQYNPTLSLGLLCEAAGARTARRACPNGVVP